MTANNCDGLTFEEATEKAGYCLMLETENAQLTRRLAIVIDNNRELTFERDTLRESEAKAWGLVDQLHESVVPLKIEFQTHEQFIALIRAVDAARAALAARKAGG